MTATHLIAAMTAPALNRLREDMASVIRELIYEGAEISSSDLGNVAFAELTARIPADVLAGLLDGTLVAVPVGDLMFGAGDFARLETYGSTDVGIKGLSNRLLWLRDRAMLAAAKSEGPA